jgi:hypothetical protein
MNHNIIFEEIKRRMEERSLYSEAAYLDLIDEVITDFISSGQMHLNEDNESLREGLEKLWREREMPGRVRIPGKQ